MDKFDVIVIGAGPAGKKTAIKLANKGLHVAIIEKDRVGGTCLNEGCIPAKLYLESASYMYKQKHFSSYGVHVENMTFDMGELKNKKEEMLNMLRSGATTSIEKSGVKLIKGEAKFVNENSIEVDGQTYSAKNFVIATGSEHRPHPILKLDNKKILSSREIFELDFIPKSILIVGGGAIGCEFATFFNSLGSKVHIAEFTPQIVPAEDSDVAKTLERELKKKGIKITVEANVTSYEYKQDSIQINMQTKKGELTEEYDIVLVSIGRQPNTSNLNLELANVKSERGFITINENLQTTNPNIYALGDTIPTPALAHSAYNEADIVANNITNDTKTSPSQVIPFVTFSSPQVASVGKNEKSLKDAGVQYEVIKNFYKSSAKAKIKGDDSGFIKVICDKNGVVIGGAIIGNDATENIHQILLAIETKLTKQDISKMVFAHPTLSESFWEMF
ncbi:dihydrolipoyl dehydrogenase [Sulfurospirillum sp. 1307]|jgi:dihydrolipoamide dehydrogenase